MVGRRPSGEHEPHDQPEERHCQLRGDEGPDHGGGAGRAARRRRRAQGLVHLDRVLRQAAGKAKSNLSRTLKAMEGYGLVRLERGPRGRIAPKLVHAPIELDLPLLPPRKGAEPRRILVPGGGCSRPRISL